MTSEHRGRWRATVATVAVAMLAGACGTDQNTPAQPGAGADPTTAGASGAGCASGRIFGAGSTFVQAMVQQWVKDFGAACPDATVNYQGVGSGAGIQQLTAGPSTSPVRTWP